MHVKKLVWSLEHEENQRFSNTLYNNNNGDDDKWLNANGLSTNSNEFIE